MSNTILSKQKELTINKGLQQSFTNSTKLSKALTQDRV